MLTRLTSHVYHLSGFPGAGVWGANVYLLAGDTLTVVDTGFRGRYRQIISAAGKLGYSPADIAGVIITHHHADHTGSLAQLKEVTQARVMAHPADAPYIDGRLPPPGPVGREWFSRAVAALNRRWPVTPVAVDMLVDEGDELPVLGGTRVLHMPGHTPGSIALLIPGERLLITGDVIAHRFGLRLPSRAFTADIAQEINSVRRVAGLDFNIICFGHGSPLVRDAHSTITSFADRLKG